MSLSHKDISILVLGSVCLSVLAVSWRGAIAQSEDFARGRGYYTEEALHLLIKVGMTTNEVIHLVGLPDRVEGETWFYERPDSARLELKKNTTVLTGFNILLKEGNVRNLGFQFKSSMVPPYGELWQIDAGVKMNLASLPTNPIVFLGEIEIKTPFENRDDDTKKDVAAIVVLAAKVAKSLNMKGVIDLEWPIARFLFAQYPELRHLKGIEKGKGSIDLDEIAPILKRRLDAVPRGRGPSELQGQTG